MKKFWKIKKKRKQKKKKTKEEKRYIKNQKKEKILGHETRISNEVLFSMINSC